MGKHRLVGVCLIPVRLARFCKKRVAYQYNTLVKPKLTVSALYMPLRMFLGMLLVVGGLACTLLVPYTSPRLEFFQNPHQHLNADPLFTQAIRCD